jgi:hypothetical protein
LFKKKMNFRNVTAGGIFTTGLHMVKKGWLFLISNFRHVPYVVCFLLGISLASDFYMPTFQNTVSSPVWILKQFSDLVILHLPAYEDGTVCSETSAYKIQTPGNYPEENKQQTYFCLEN